MAAKIEPTDRQSAGAAMGSDDQLNQQILTIVQDLQGVGLQPSHLEGDEPVERDDLRSGIAPYLDQETSERKAIYDRLVGIEREMKKRGSQRFTRYLIAILIGVAARPCHLRPSPCRCRRRRGPDSTPAAASLADENARRISSSRWLGE